MLISRDKYYLGTDGTQRLTIAHEIIHWYLHQKYFKLLALLDDQSDMMSCEVEPSRYEESMTMAQKAHWYAEWQANALAIRIAMHLTLCGRHLLRLARQRIKISFQEILSRMLFAASRNCSMYQSSQQNSAHDSLDLKQPTELLFSWMVSGTSRLYSKMVTWKSVRPM